MNRYVTFLDIIGFGDFVKADPLAEVKSRVAEALKSLEKSKEAAPMVGFDQVAVKPVHVFSFSDTFVFLSDDDSEAAFLSHLSATIFLTRTLFAQALPVRGAMTFGEADFIDEKSNHAVGKAIVAAAELEKQQDWIGVLLEEASFPASGKTLAARKEFASVLLRWDVPMKKATVLKDALVINWRYNLQLKGEASALFRRSEDKSVEAKIAQTMRFEAHLREKHLHEGKRAVTDKNGKDIYTPWLEPVVSKVG